MSVKTALKMVPSILSTTSSILKDSLRINSSEQPNATNSSFPQIRPSDIGMSFFTMIFGAVSSLTALGILAKSRVRFRRQAKAPFFILTVALLLADFGSHVIPGSFAMFLHINYIYKLTPGKPNKTFCEIFGASMVFFGLSPLLLGCAMAVERCVAICYPFFHVAMITVAHVRRVVLFVFTLAFVLAVLPFFSVGNYTIQHPQTWCFLQIQSPHSSQDANMALAFSGLGLAALSFSLLCNILSGLLLLQARRKSKHVYRQSETHCTRNSSTSSSLFCSLDVEMMVQLAVITVVSCVCWSPFLIHTLMLQFNQISTDSPQDRVILLGLRMASWNQILDPWVYILLRRTVLFRVCCRRTDNNSLPFTRREAFILQ